MALKDVMNGGFGKSFDLPEIAGTYKGKKLCVVGDAAGVWDDLEALGCRYDHKRGAVASFDYDFLTINKIVETFPGNIEHAYSNEPQHLARYIAARRPEYSHLDKFKGPVHVHSIQKPAQWIWPWHGYGTSGLGAALVGVGLGYEEIVLCGVPLDNGPHNGEPPWRRCTFTSEAASANDIAVNKQWKRAIDLAFEGKVFSMSGRTKLWLGPPPGLSSSAAAPASATHSTSRESSATW